MTTRAALGLWTPTNETVQSIGNALCAHWAAARNVAAASPFFRRSANWLEVSRHSLSMGGVLVRRTGEQSSAPKPGHTPR